MAKCIALYHPFREIVDDSRGWGSSSSTWQHGRKYLRASGCCVRRVNGKPKHVDKLFFWGEYEAPTKTSRIDPPRRDKTFPTVLHRIIRNVPINRTKAPWQNTDPFVFNGPFVYSNCRQKTNAVLRGLDRGDIILFVSRYQFEYYLDTVFVVNRIYDPLFDRECQIRRTYRGCEAFERVTGRQIDNIDDYRFVTYTGREYGQKPYSFVPCWTESNQEGHQRVKISHPSMEASTRRQFKILEGEPDEIWRAVAENVINMGASLATFIDHPLTAGRPLRPSCW